MRPIVLTFEIIKIILPRLTAVFLLLLLTGVHAFADGCFVWQRGADLNEPSQKAILCMDEGKETLILQVKYAGEAKDFAWIVPLPAKPDVSVIDDEESPFAEISLYTQRRNRWGYRGRDSGEDVKSGTVRVLEQKTVGVYDIAALAANDAKALSDWLNKNGYAFPEKRKDVLAHYTRKKWVYVAMRISAAALSQNGVDRLKSGELQPIRFTFEASEMVYPLTISSVNAGETELLLYVLADTPMHVVNSEGRAGLSISNNLAPFSQYRDARTGTWRKTTGFELPLTWRALRLPANKSLSLCKYREIYTSKDMHNDLTFTPFDAETYWRRQLKKEKNAKNAFLQQRALSVLAYYDVDILRKLADDKSERSRIAAASAINAGSPLDLIQRLARDSSVNVRKAVARNTETPVSILSELSKDKASSVREAVALNIKTPPKRLWEMIDAPDLVGYVARNQGLSLEMLRALAANANPDTRAIVAANPSTPEEILLVLARDEDSRVKKSILAHPARPVAVLKVLAKDTDPTVRANLAYYSRLPMEILTILLQDPEPCVRIAIGQNSAIWNSSRWQDISRELARDKDEGVRLVAAANPCIDQETLLELASDPSSKVRLVVAGNTKVTPDILAKLAADEDVLIRRTVAWQDGTPPQALTRLAVDKDADVRTSVVLNANTPASALDRMVNDPIEKIRVHLIWRKQISVKALTILAGDTSETIRRQIAGNSRLPAGVIEQLARDKIAIVRRRVCDNEKITEKTLIQLAGDESMEVKSAVAMLPKTPATALRLLAENPGFGPAVAGHPNTPIDLIETLAQSKSFYTRRAVAKRPDALPRILQALAKDVQSGIRYTVAINRNTPTELLEELAEDSIAGVRKGVTQNPATGEKTLKKLALDKDVGVVEAAKKALEKLNN